jgi:hypothetical protein
MRVKDIRYIFGGFDYCNCNLKGFMNEPTCYPGDHYTCSPDSHGGAHCCDSFPDSSTDNAVSDDCSSDLQGSNRLQRGLIYMSYLKMFWSEHNYEPVYTVVPHMAHNYTQYFFSSQFAKWAFENGPVVPSMAPTTLAVTGSSSSLRGIGTWSIGAKVGLAVGLFVVVMGAAVAGVLLYRWRVRSKTEVRDSVGSPTEMTNLASVTDHQQQEEGGAGEGHELENDIADADFGADPESDSVSSPIFPENARGGRASITDVKLMILNRPFDDSNCNSDGEVSSSQEMRQL